MTTPETKTERTCGSCKWYAEDPQSVPGERYGICGCEVFELWGEFTYPENTCDSHTPTERTTDEQRG